ncbi:hypothetical protein BC351_08645 [Paenibacillus ferrarius]|uniref:Uncharacterized protein n=1 Tax=Paenibacillus ferrarius TaxID=1469647 RepID=A0A1V4HA20_9BACL|nr:hypothetical protein BC351_08645 [Paenibacillus ferrarius]
MSTAYFLIFQMFIFIVSLIVRFFLFLLLFLEFDAGLACYVIEGIVTAIRDFFLYKCFDHDVDDNDKNG